MSSLSPKYFRFLFTAFFIILLTVIEANLIEHYLFLPGYC